MRVFGAVASGRQVAIPAKANRALTLEDIAQPQVSEDRYPGLPIVSSGRSYGGMHALAAMIESPASDLLVAEMPVTDVGEFLETERSAARPGTISDSRTSGGRPSEHNEPFETWRNWSPAQRVNI